MKKCKMCDNEIPNNRIYCGNTCKYSDSELHLKRTRKEKNDENKKLKCKLCGWETKDILNLGGHPKKHLLKKHNLQTNDYLDFFEEMCEEKIETWNCPECDWKTKDLTNKSGWITTHVLKHYKNLENFTEKYPQYNYLFNKQLNIIDKQKDIELKGNNIECKICHKLFYKLTQTHLTKHRLTPTEYKEKFNVDITCSPKTSQKQKDKSNNPEIKNKMIQSILKTNQEKFGFNSYTQTEEGKKKVRRKTLINTYNKYINSETLNKHVKLLFTVDEYDGNINSEYRFLCKKCNAEFIGKLENGRIPRCFNCYPKINKGYSNIEKDIANFIRNEITSDIEENKKIQGKIELDIFSKKFDIGIEHDGIYWHSELNGKNENYHLNKTVLCNDMNIHLIHIFEDEWIHKQDIVKSRLKNYFNVIKNKIYARVCEIKEISINERRDFLEKNHLQGDDNSSIRLGLFYKNELVSVMTFSKSRFSKNVEYEMTRFANKIDFSVIGAFNKLLKFFIKKYSPKSIVSFADRRWSNRDNIYEKSGFKFISDTKPSYWYFNKAQTRIHRFNFRKSVLRKKLEVFDENLTEWQNMQLNGYDRIWDCGSYKYEMVL